MESPRTLAQICLVFKIVGKNKKKRVHNDPKCKPDEQLFSTAVYYLLAFFFPLLKSSVSWSTFPNCMARKVKVHICFHRPHFLGTGI